MVNTQKKSTVQSLEKTLLKNSNFVLIKFDKTTHKSLESLRKALKAESATFSVIKNTLFEKAVNNLISKSVQFKEVKKKYLPLREASALLTLEKDWNKGLGVFHKFAESEKTLSFKFGILDNINYGGSALDTIAKLPGKDQLMAKIIGSMKSPTSRLVYASKYGVQKLVYILNTKSKNS